MTTRAVLLTSSGAVHRVVDSNGTDMTACGETYQKAIPVTPLQALVHALPECHGPLCWSPGMWEHFKEGIGT
jgi:hypothetical protein